ncbi:GNAT family N-acetyltransferase [Paenactinomyces guangxiensis]|uniref:GNAT family N-acetyltransferase n=1 Tax=Paenactinomyces guangxiensis TaxID=1490290 RepID=A0A7W1WUG2_9BACL|nr:GNAT family N-acetyltransferase [Paenactinomyces guangxiensis]MBA4496167.1 GNAT family N-acetyltransferase [Paenactinomyces guangxiensis]MBH8593255.1 GNAT family N-acetyltransferase [Paenactinomyces guangxiensis]
MSVTKDTYCKNSFNIERLTKQDIQDVIGLSDQLGWDYSAEELELILQTGYLYGHKNENGKVISTAAIFPYGTTLASLGTVMVDPGCRGMGIGTAITKKCINMFPNTPVTLVSTDQGKPLYQKLGFKTVGTLYKLIANKYQNRQSPADDSYIIHPIRKEDIKEILRLDRQAFGADRAVFLKHRITQARFSAVLKNPTGEMVGFALGIQNPEMLVIGPVIAPGPLMAGWLIHEIAGKYQGTLRIDVPSEHQALLDSLFCSGFETVNQPPVMLLNGDRLPSRHLLFAIAAQAYG